MSDPVSERYKEALRRGHVAVVRGRPREALQHYEEAGRLVSHRALPFVSMGGVLLQMRRPQEALVAYDEALRRAPDDLGALRGRLHALEAAGRRAEAEELAQRLAAIDNEALAGYRGPSGGTLRRPPAGEMRFATASAAQSVGDTAKAVDAYVAAAREYSEGNAMDAALDACHRALELAPGSVEAHLAMTAVYLRRGWRELAGERVGLLDHFVAITEDPRARATFTGMLRELRSRHPELAASAPPPV